MKKLWLMLLAGVLALGLAGCGDDGRVADDATPVWLLTREVKCAADGTVESSKVMEYNSDGLLMEVSWLNENGETTRSLQYVYTDDGRPKTVRDSYSDGYYTEIEYEYDYAYAESGEIVRHWEGVGDERHLVGEITVVYAPGEAKYHYNNSEHGKSAKYHLCRWFDDEGALRYTTNIAYDEYDNVLSAVNQSPDGTVQSVTRYDYDEAGRKVAYRQYDGEDNLTYSYDTAYDERGNKVKVSGGGVDETDRHITEYEYDEQGNMLRQINRYADGGAVFDYTEYTYDEDGRKTAQIYYIGSLEDGDWADEYRYVYDEDGNLVKLESVDESSRVYSWREYEYTQVMVPAARLEQVQATQKEWWAGV